MSTNEYTEIFRQWEYNEQRNPNAKEQNAMGLDGWELCQIIKGDTPAKDRWIYKRELAPRRVPVRPIELKAAKPAGVWTVGAVSVADGTRPGGSNGKR
jgi:hypothetical protein